MFQGVTQFSSTVQSATTQFQPSVQFPTSTDLSAALFQLSERVESPARDRLVWVQQLDLSTLTTSDLVSILRACRQSPVESDFWSALCQQALSRDDFTPADIGTASSAIAHHYNRGPLTDAEHYLLARLCICALPIAEQFLEKSLVGLLNALAMLNIFDEPIVRHFSQVAKSRIENFSVVEISLVLHALSIFRAHDEKLASENQELVDSLCHEISKRAIDPTSLSRTLTAMVKLDKHDPTLMRMLCNQASKRAEDFSPHALAETLHVLAVMCVFDSALVQRLARAAESKANSFLAKDIAIALTSFARLGMTFGSSHRKLYAAAVAKASDFNSEDITTTLNALTEFHFYHKDLVKRLLKEAFVKAETFTPRHIAIFFNTLGKFGVCDKWLILKMTDVALSKVPEFDPRTLSTVLNSVVKMGFYDPALVERLRDEAMLRADEFNAEAMIGVLHALERLHCKDQALAERMFAVTQTGKFNFQDYSLDKLFAGYDLATEPPEEKEEKEKRRPRTSLGHFLEAVE